MTAVKRTVLGRTGIEVTELCFGTLILGHLQANLPPEDGALAVRRALELGVNFIDTAKGYKTYPHTRLGIEGFTDVVIASKSPAKSAAEMRVDVEACLRDLGRDTIDIFHLHLIRSRQDMLEREDALGALVKCREEGKIRAIGLTAHGPQGVLCALDYDEIEVAMPLLNRRGMGIIGGTLDGMIEAVRQARRKGIGLYDMKPLGGGHLIDDIPACIDYLRGLDLFDSVAVGLKTPEEAEVMAGVFAGDAASRERALAMGRGRKNRKSLIVYDFICQKCGSCIEECPQDALSMGEKTPVVDADKCILCGYCASSCPTFAIRVI